MELKFRNLKPNEIDVRVDRFTPKSKPTHLSVLLYKDARVDMQLLDEVVGPLNWKREHTRDNHNCIVSIYDEDKKVWVSKEDVGMPSNFDSEKGLASDSFKRACVNWGIGRELYSTPDIYIPLKDVNWYAGNNPITYDKFEVTDISYDENKNINFLEIVNTSKSENGKSLVVFQFATYEKLLSTIKEENIDVDIITRSYKVDSLTRLNTAQYGFIVSKAGIKFFKACMLKEQKKEEIQQEEPDMQILSSDNTEDDLPFA